MSSDRNTEDNSPNVGISDPQNVKSALKVSNSSAVSTQLSGDRTRSVGFKLDKECQTILGQDSNSKHASMTSQTSTEDKETTSPSTCRCFYYRHCENINTSPNVECSGGFHSSENLKYIDCNGEESYTHEQNDEFNEFYRGFSTL